MNITFLLGNGFDIGLGLQTRYEDFYQTYTKINSNDSENVRRFKKELSNKDLNYSGEITDWSDFEKAFGQYSDRFNVDTKMDYLECFEDFVIQFNAYLEAEEKRVDFSDKKLITQTMFNAVTQYFYIREGDKAYIQSLYPPVASSSRIYNFISFNYTRTVDKCANILQQHLKSDNARGVGKVLHIHGYVEENMIMGVNDKSQIINRILAEDMEVSREIIKPNQNIDMRTNYEKTVIEVINKSDIICVYGMSIGETDKKWWNQIGKWLGEKEKHALVILKYDEKYNKRFSFNQNKLVNAITNRFLELSEQPTEIQNKIRSKIFVGMNHNVFTMKLCKERGSVI